MSQRRTGDWVSSVTRHYERFRFQVGHPDKKPTYHAFSTREEAEEERAAAIRAQERKRIAADRMTWRKAIEDFMQHQAERAKAQEQSRAVVRDRLLRFFASVLDLPVALSEQDGLRLYRELRQRKGARGAPCSVQEHHHCLSRAKALARWLVKQKVLRENTLADVEAVGVPKAGEESKPQLNRDQLWQLWQTALPLGEQGDAGAAAAMCCSLLGLRASTVTNRQRQHLDAGGTILKSTAKGKTVELSLRGETPDQELVMARFRRVLAAQARGKTPLAPLIGTGHDRWWVYREVHRLCELAGVPKVPPHGLRGTHASVGRSLGISPALLAGALAHSQQVQERHYATAGAIAAGQQARVVGAITHSPAFRPLSGPDKEG